LSISTTIAGSPQVSQAYSGFSVVGLSGFNVGDLSKFWRGGFVIVCRSSNCPTHPATFHNILGRHVCLASRGGAASPAQIVQSIRSHQPPCLRCPRSLPLAGLPSRSSYSSPNSVIKSSMSPTGRDLSINSTYKRSDA